MEAAFLFAAVRQKLPRSVLPLQWSWVGLALVVGVGEIQRPIQNR